MKKLTRIVTSFLSASLIVTSLMLPAHATEDPLLVDSVQSTAAEDVMFNTVPLYFQTDYPDVPYGHGTVASSGCGITCLAMVASYLTDTSILPDELARRFGHYSASNLERMEYAAANLDIPRYDKVYDWESVIDALANDKVVIIMVGESSRFTGTQHFLVLTGMTADGRIMVNDPYEPNYGSQELLKGFENGFEQSFISMGFSGGWTFEAPDKPKAQEEIILNEETNPEPEVTPSETPQSFDTVPTYFQTDYSYIRFGSGTIASSGCSITSLAMVASYLTEHAYTPDQLADYFADFNGNNMQILEYGSDFLQLPWEKAENFHVAMQALREGKVVIAMMGSNSLFTSGQHFIVLTGINENGLIMVNDPNEANYSLWNLKNAFVNGFKEGDIGCGYSGAWIYDKSAMPEEPFIYVEEEVYIEPRYPDITLTNEERDLVAKIIWLEARGESFEGQQAIAEIVFNRIYAEDFPNSIKGVIFSKGQFPTTAFLDTAEPKSIQYEAIERALSGPYVLPKDVTLFARTALNSNIWGTIGGHTFCYSET